MKIEFVGTKMAGALSHLQDCTTNGSYDKLLGTAAVRILFKVQNWYLHQDNDGKVWASRSISPDEEPSFASLAAEVEAVQRAFSEEIDRLLALRRDLEALGYKAA